LFYLIKRGPESGSLEQALKAQALESAIPIHYNSTRSRQEVDIWAAGAPSGGFFLGAGLTFRTTHPDVVMVLVDNQIAPKAYAYLVIVNGYGTLSVVLTRDFKAAPAYLERCMGAFHRHKSFSMDNIHRASGFGGLVSAFWQPAAASTGPLVVGEAGGFQDFLWGFGIRHALHTGQLAAQALAERGDYEALLMHRVRPLVRASIANRVLYDWGDNRLYQLLVRRFATSRDLSASVRHWYVGLPLHRLLWPLAQRRYRSL
jgi:flavin-dependent dehydrogenase